MCQVMLLQLENLTMYTMPQAHKELPNHKTLQ